jgi:anti-anti-sigma regulatory factor
MKAAPRQRAKALALPAVMDIGNAQDLMDSLVAALEQNSVLRLDGSKITQVSTPAVQVLLAASQSAAEGGGRLILAKPAQALKDAFENLGLPNQLKEWSAANG